MAKDKSKAFSSVLGEVGNTAGLRGKDETVKKVSSKKTAPEKGLPQPPKTKKKVITIEEAWEERIKLVHFGAITDYITTAIKEKMKRDKIL